jgi:hypothetical protein
MRPILLFISISVFVNVQGQDKGKSKDSNELIRLIDSLNRTLDRSVVEKNIAFLEKHFADDFVFIHATGMVDSTGQGDVK